MGDSVDAQVDKLLAKQAKCYKDMSHAQLVNSLGEYVKMAVLDKQPLSVEGLKEWALSEQQKTAAFDKPDKQQYSLEFQKYQAVLDFLSDSLDV